jgi:hypothetical protein
MSYSACHIGKSVSYWWPQARASPTCCSNSLLTGHAGVVNSSENDTAPEVISRSFTKPHATMSAPRSGSMMLASA